MCQSSKTKKKPLKQKNKNKTSRFASFSCLNRTPSVFSMSSLSASVFSFSLPRRIRRRSLPRWKIGFEPSEPNYKPPACTHRQTHTALEGNQKEKTKAFRCCKGNGLACETEMRRALAPSTCASQHIAALDASETRAYPEEKVEDEEEILHTLHSSLYFPHFCRTGVVFPSLSQKSL